MSFISHIFSRFFGGGWRRAMEERREAYYSLFARDAIPGIRMLTDAEAPPVSPGSSKLGGRPDLPVGMEWPCADGHALAFIAQVNLAELAPHDHRHELPHEGLLLFFLDLDDWESGRVLYTEAGAELEARDFPEALEEELRLAERALSFAPVSMPTNDPSEWDMKPYVALYQGDEDAAMDAYCELRAQYIGYKDADESGTFLLGAPDTLQGELDTAPGERLLFQLASFEDARGELMVGDCGNVYFLIHENDLAARDFSRVRVEMQCY